MSDVLQLDITVKKNHIAILSVVVLVASASAAVNVRDPMNVFGDLNMQGNKVVNATEYRFTRSFIREYDKDNNGQIGPEELGDAGSDFVDDELSQQQLQVVGEYFISEKQISRGVKAAPLSESGKIIASGAYTGTKNGPTQAGNFTFSSDINLQNNNIYNAANINTGNGGGGGGSGGGLSMPKGSFSCEGPEGCGSNPVKTFDPANGYLVSAQIEMAGTDGVGSFDSTSIRLNYVDGSSSTYKVSDDLYARSKKIHAYNTPNKKVDTIDVLVDAGSGDFYTSDHSVKWALVSGGTGEDGQTGGGGGGASNAAPPLDWSNAQPVKNGGEIQCEPGEVLRDVTCFSNAPSGFSDDAGDNVNSCNTRTESFASNSGGDVAGTCVPLKGVKRQVFSDQNSSNTFQVPPGTSSVRYRVYGGVGGSERVGFDESGQSGGAGGYVEGSVPVDGETTLNVYVGQNGGGGDKLLDFEGVGNPDFVGEPEGSGGRGGCVPFNGVKCGGDGGDGFYTKGEDDPGNIVRSTAGAGGGGAPSIVTDSTGQIMVAAGGGGGASSDSGGGGGAGGGSGSQPTEYSKSNAGEDADTATTKNLGGNAGVTGIIVGQGSGEPGDTFVSKDLPEADSTGTSREGAKVELAAFP